LQGGDVNRGFYIGGATAGAHLAAISTIRSRKNLPEVKISGQCLIVPTVIAWTDVETLPKSWVRVVASNGESAEAPLLSEEGFQRYLSLLSVPDDEKQKGENLPV
jgi:alpha/beta hydrolase fold